MPASIKNAQTTGNIASAEDLEHVTDTTPDQTASRHQTGVHPVAIEIALAAALWFIAVTWVSFARGPEVDWDLVIVTLFFIFFFALFLFAASHALKDPRWRQRKTNFREFLESEVGTATGSMRGREVLLEIAVISRLARLRRNADRRDLDRRALAAALS